jgi:hypothetical protein
MAKTLRTASQRLPTIRTDSALNKARLRKARYAGAGRQPQCVSTTIPQTAAQLDEYGAKYTSSVGTFFVTREDQQLLVRLSGQIALPVFASAPDAFFYKAVDAQITFVRDSSGRITGLVLHQNGADYPAQREEASPRLLPMGPPWVAVAMTKSWKMR